MLALSIRQPFAAAIFAGLKPLEYRTWPTEHRGPLLIHASARRPSPADLEDFPDLEGADLPTRVLLGVVQLVDCELGMEALLDGGKVISDPEYWWHLANPRAFAVPIPYKGRLRL